MAGIDSLVVSGGTAVILATAADFATRDIDLVTPDGDALDTVLVDLGFDRRNDFQHIWQHDDLGLYVQVAASALPPNSRVDEVEAPGGEVVTIWSATDLVLDRLSQATLEGAHDRLDQALTLLARAGGRFDATRARQRAASDGVAAQLESLLELFAVLKQDPPATEADDAIARFWRDVQEKQS